LNTDLRRTSPSAERNKGPILEVLTRLFPTGETALVLEIACGVGTHAMHFARALPHLTWQPSDPDRESLASVAAHMKHAGLPNVNAPLSLDVRNEPWPLSACDAIFCANMIHISPWEATQALVRNAGKLLSPGGRLITYGPYFQTGVEPAAGNVSFDADLRSRNPQWGIRELDEIIALTGSLGFSRPEVVQMPANNLTLIFTRT